MQANRKHGRIVLLEVGKGVRWCTRPGHLR